MKTKVSLEEVFKTSGIPTYTFVRPTEWDGLLVALRTKGKGVIVEGPSGIGKTTCVMKLIQELKMDSQILTLTARKKEDKDLILELPRMKQIGTVLIDDFHVLKEKEKSSIADFLKVLADEETPDSKLILVGINKAGDSLVKIAPDLNNRIDTIRFETNPENKVLELVQGGEKALNISIQAKSEIVSNSHGSFHIAQMFCLKLCVLGQILEEQEQKTKVHVSFSLVNEKLIEELGRIFYPRVKNFSIGSKLKRGGRAPYLHLLYWLSQSENWTIQIDDVVLGHQNFKGSVNQVVEKGYLSQLISENKEFQDIIYFDDQSRILSVVDPKFYFFLKNIMWTKVAKEIGFARFEFKARYDFALSFAGEDRWLAEKIYDSLTENEVEVFYDKNEQHRILAEDVEEYLAPIYRSEASFVIVLLSKSYPRKIWTKFESEQFKHRFGENCVIPIWFSDVDLSLFDVSRKVGGVTYYVDKPVDKQVNEISEVVIKKITNNG